MDRRELLKKTPLWLASVAVVPTLFQILSSCTTKKKVSWKPVFLTKSQVFVVENLSNLILPTSETIGALDVNVTRFIDLILKNVFPEEVQQSFKKGAELFQNKFEKMFQKNISEGKKEDFFKILSLYFNQNEEKQQQIFNLLEKYPKKAENKGVYYIYRYLTFIRHYTLFGFFTSEKVGKEVLNYNPSPGFYNGCVPYLENDTW